MYCSYVYMIQNPCITTRLCFLAPSRRRIRATNKTCLLDHAIFAIHLNQISGKCMLSRVKVNLLAICSVIKCYGSAYFHDNINKYNRSTIIQLVTSSHS